MVHYLFNHEPERFQDFQRRLATTGDGLAAWREAFPDLTAAEMDARLHAYAFDRGTFSMFKARAPEVSYVAHPRPLTDADVHAVRALLYTAALEPRVDLARAELAEALRLDPTQVIAAYIQRIVLRDDETDLDLPRRLVAGHPSDPMAWLILAHARQARHEPEEAKEAFEEAVRFGGEPEAPIPVELRVARPD